MSEPESPQPPSPPPAAPPPGAAPPPPQTAPAPPGGASSNRNLMIVLAYVWILAIVPLIVEKDDAEVQWHAKHGLVLLGAEILAQIALMVINWVVGSFVPFVGCVTCALPGLVFVGFLVVRVLAIVKGVNGERFLVPGLSELVAKF